MLNFLYEVHTVNEHSKRTYTAVSPVSQKENFSTLIKIMHINMQNIKFQRSESTLYFK